MLVSVSAQRSRGTGVSEYSRVWYTLDDGGFSEVLEHGHRGYLSGWTGALTSNFESQVVLSETEDGDPRIELLCNWDYEVMKDGEDFGVVLSTTGIASFVWRRAGGRFYFQPECSDVREDAAEHPLASITSFFERNVERLVASARAPVGKEREWLTVLPKQEPGSCAARRIMQALENR